MLAFQAEMTMARPAGDDDSLRGKRFAIDGQAEGLPRHVHRLDAAELDPRADAFREAGIVFDDRRRGQQAARLGAGQDKWSQIGARRVESGGKAGATRTDDKDRKSTRLNSSHANI